MNEQNIKLTGTEAGTILVALCEFEVMIEEKPKTFGCYDEVNQKLIEKFRDLAWKAIQNEK